MFEQQPTPIDIQIIEIHDPIVPLKRKINTHIGFISDTPKEDIQEIKKWCKTQKIRCRDGGWSEKELWFDLPDIFCNFVIEIMHTSVVE
jgi:hypothetical protein